MQPSFVGGCSGGWNPTTFGGRTEEQHVVHDALVRGGLYAHQLEWLVGQGDGGAQVGVLFVSGVLREHHLLLKDALGILLGQVALGLGRLCGASGRHQR